MCGVGRRHRSRLLQDIRFAELALLYAAAGARMLLYPGAFKSAALTIVPADTHAA
jgi:hypothetical protein